MTRRLWMAARWGLLLASLMMGSALAAQQASKPPDFEAEGDIDLDLATNTATLTGDVRLIARKPREATLTAREAKLQLDENRRTVLQAEATGNVQFDTTTAATTASPARTVSISCGSARYQPAGGTVVLAGDPKAQINTPDEKASVQKMSLSGGQMTYALAEETLAITGSAHIEGLASPTDKIGRQRIIADSDSATFDQKAQTMVLRGGARLQFVPIPATEAAPSGAVEGETIEFDLANGKARVRGGPKGRGHLQFDIPPAEGGKGP